MGYQDGVDWTYNHYLAEELGSAGYQTACVGKMHVHPPRLACGYQTLRLHDATSATIAMRTRRTGTIRRSRTTTCATCATAWARPSM